MDDDFRNALSFGLHFLQNKSARHGINSKTTLLETALLGLEAFQHVDRQQNTHAHHPDGMLFETLLSGDFNAGMQKVMEIAQAATDEQFEGLAQRFVNYNAVLAGAEKRKRLMLLFGCMMMTRGGQGSISQQREPEPRVVYRDREVVREVERAPLPPPPHPDETLFRPYFDDRLTVPAAMAKLRQDLAQYDDGSLQSFLLRFTAYAATLRDGDTLKRAFGLNTQFALMLRERKQAARLAAPERRQLR